jgi:hypothetical protein
MFAGEPPPWAGAADVANRRAKEMTCLPSDLNGGLGLDKGTNSS